MVLISYVLHTCCDDHNKTFIPYRVLISYVLHTCCDVLESVEKFILFTKTYCTRFVFSFIQPLLVKNNDKIKLPGTLHLFI